MIVLIIKVVLTILVLLLLLKVWGCWKTYLNYKKQGVAFNDRQGFSLLSDTNLLINEVIGEDFKWLQAISKCCDGVIPPIFGWIFPEIIGLSLNSVEYLEGIYVQQNQHHSKYHHDKEKYNHFIPTTILF